tara:strand:+ start:389 stop:517 length:129 start_codon:yes stop_codon:yes gene_type:complete
MPSKPLKVLFEGQSELYDKEFGEDANFESKITEHLEINHTNR